MVDSSLSQIRVLHVDDDLSVADLTKPFLEREDGRFCVETVQNADEGLQLISDRPPDCVVSDYNMPGKDGLEFLNAVREEHPDLPFILFTGKGSEAVASDAISAGVTDYLQKQSGTEQYELLANRIRNAVDARREAKRVRRQEQLMRLTELAGDTGGFELDVDSGEVLLTEGTRRLIGASANTQLTLEDTIELYHPDDQADVRQTITQAAETGEEIRESWRLQTLDGEDRLVNVTITPATEDSHVTALRGAIHDVTNRTERQQELRRLRQAIDAANVPITLSDPSKEDTPLVYVNDAFADVTGYSPAEALGRNCRFLQGENTDPEKIATLQKAIDNGDPISVELRNYRNDGTEFWNHLTLTPIYDDSGQLVRYLGTQEDITERKERERELRAERRFIKQALDALDDVFYVLNTDGTLRRWNARVPEITGYTDQDLEEMYVTELFPDDERETLTDAIEAAPTDEQEPVEADVRTANGERRPYEFTGAQLTDADGNTTGLVGIGRDLSERRRRERRFQALVEESNDLISVVDADGVFQYQSPSIKRILGYSPDETLGDTAWEYVHPDDRAGLIEAFEHGIDNADANPVIQYRARHANGSWRWLEARGNNQLANPVVDGYIINSRDITDRKQHEQELKRARDLMSDIEQLADIGAWEYDPDSDTTMMTGGTRRILGLEPEAECSIEEAFGCFHPADRERLTERFTECLETGASYEIDVRLTTAEGAQRWVRARCKRMDGPDSEGVVRGYVREITEERTRERQLTELNEVSNALLTAETRQDVADIAVEAAKDVLDFQANAIHLSEAEETQLTPVAQTDKLRSLLEEVPTLPVADSIAGRAYQRGEPIVTEDARQDPDVYDPETTLQGHVYLPLANHGVLIASSEAPAAFDEQDRALGELLAGTLVAAFDRIDREQTAHQRQQQLSLFFEESPLGAIQWDDEFRVERVNGRTEEILGYSETELRGESWEQIVAEDDRERVGTAVERLLDADGGHRVLNENVRSDGETLTCEWHNRAVTDADGTVNSVFSKFQDVTDRERANRELEAYKPIIEALGDAVYVLDEEGRFIYVNDEFTTLVGYGRETILGSAPSLIKDEDARDRTERALEQVLSSDGRETTTFEVTIQPRNDDPVVCEEHMSGLPYEGEQLTGCVGTLREITEQKRRKQELTTLTGQYRTLIENFPDGAVFLFDRSYQYVQAGGQELAAVGLSSEEVTGSTPDELFPDEIADELVQYYSKTLDGTTHTFEQEYAGERYRIQTVPVRTGDAEVTHGIAVSTNITEQAVQRRELKRQKDGLEEFASIVSHDLRSPLAVAEGRLELARETCEGDDLVIAADAIDRSQALIDDLLTLAQEGKRTAEVDAVTIAEVAQEVWRTTETGSATLAVDGTQTIEADRSRLQQLLENLYQNANEHGDGDITVIVGAIDGGFYVEDTGPGIPESAREEIFEAGYSTRSDGTGFGLRIVEEIADAHEWEVTVTDGEQGGARFEFTGIQRVDE